MRVCFFSRGSSSHTSRSKRSPPDSDSNRSNLKVCGRGRQGRRSVEERVGSASGLDCVTSIDQPRHTGQHQHSAHRCPLPTEGHPARGDGEVGVHGGHARPSVGSLATCRVAMAPTADDARAVRRFALQRQPVFVSGLHPCLRRRQRCSPRRCVAAALGVVIVAVEDTVDLAHHLTRRTTSREAAYSPARRAQRHAPGVTVEKTFRNLIGTEHCRSSGIKRAQASVSLIRKFPTLPASRKSAQVLSFILRGEN